MKRQLNSQIIRSLIDYAGMFPPADLSAIEAAGEYLRILQTPAGGLVGPFLVRASDIDRLPGNFNPPLGIIADQGLADALTIAVASDQQVVQIELVLRHTDRLGAMVTDLDAAAPSSEGLSIFFEVPHDSMAIGIYDVAHIRDRTVLGRSVHAKLRTGGTSPSAVPTCALVAEFIVRCTEISLSYKATAGLHHPLRHRDSSGTWQHGFLNVVAGSFAAVRGASVDEVASILEVEDAGDLDLPWTDAEVAAVRSMFVSFGSCSVAEPYADLIAHSWIEVEAPGGNAANIHSSVHKPERREQ